MRTPSPPREPKTRESPERETRLDRSASRIVETQLSLLPPLLLSLLLGICAGCAARGTVSGQGYRLTPIEGAKFLLPPDYSEKPKATREIVPLNKLGGGRIQVAGGGCSVRDRWFSFYRRDTGKKTVWLAEVPRPSAWFSAGFGDARAEWNHFLDQLGELEARRCITARNYQQARKWIGESVPTPLITAFFFRYSFDDRGFVTLQPDMRLLVERSIFRKGPHVAETVANYLGERKVYYDVSGTRGETMAIKRRRIQRSKGLTPSAGSEFPDTRLAQRFKGMRAIRLFVLTLFVPPNVRRKALLVGVRNPDDMMEATSTVLKHPQVPCKDLAARGIACASFEGMVSVAAEVNVDVNGKWRYFPITSVLSAVLNPLSAPERTRALRTLRIQRLFRGRYYSVEFKHDDPDVPKLVLFAGDRISWSQERSRHSIR